MLDPLDSPDKTADVGLASRVLGPVETEPDIVAEFDPLDPPGKTVRLVPPKLVTTDVSAPNKVCSISEYEAVSFPVLEELRIELEELALLERVCVVPPSS